jgi:phosphate acetyltransferase
VRTLTLEDIRAFAAVSGDTNPAHLDADYADATLFHGVIAHGMWGGALISALLGTVFPGPGTIYVEQALHFSRPVRVGDTLTVTVTVTAKDDAKKRVEMDCLVVNQRSEKVLSGMARVLAPTQRVRRMRVNAPQIQLFDPDARLRGLLAQGAGIAPVRCGVVHPCDADSLQGAMEAARVGLLDPLLIGPEARIRELAEEHGVDIGGIDIAPAAHSHAAAALATAMASDNRVEALMKGSLHTDELIHAVLMEAALRTARRMSHVFRFDVPTYGKPLLLTDAAVNIRPTLAEKADIVQNAILFAHIMGVQLPKVAVLSAVETINPGIPSTLDAAALCKMAQRGQITGGLLDGPLAFDNAISAHAASIKNIASDVAGDADILVVPDLESGNMLGKQLQYLGGATSSGIVLGARVPIALTSRADGPTARIASALLAKLVAHHNRQRRT